MCPMEGCWCGCRAMPTTCTALRWTSTSTSSWRSWRTRSGRPLRRPMAGGGGEGGEWWCEKRKCKSSSGGKWWFCKILLMGHYYLIGSVSFLFFFPFPKVTSVNDKWMWHESVVSSFVIKIIKSQADMPCLIFFLQPNYKQNIEEFFLTRIFLI